MRRVLVVGMAILVIASVAPFLAASDQSISRAILDQLRQKKEAGDLKGFKVDLTVDNGTVWVKGHVADSQQQKMVLDIARRVPGVTQVVNELSIKSGAAPLTTPSAAPKPAKTDLLGSLGKMLRKPESSEPATAVAMPGRQVAHNETEAPKPMNDAPESPASSRRSGRKPATGEKPDPAKSVDGEPTPVAVKPSDMLVAANTPVANVPAEKAVSAEPVTKPTALTAEPPAESETTEVNPEDERIVQDILERLKVLKNEGKLANFSIDLQCDHGDVEVKGRTTDRQQQWLVLDVARRIPGVKKVVNAIKIDSAAASTAGEEVAAKLEAESTPPATPSAASPAKSDEVSDQSIAQEIVSKLNEQKKQGKLKGFGIDLNVINGDVWLKGTVANPQQLDLVIDIARHVRGVRQVVNEVSVNAPAPSPAKPAEAAPATEVATAPSNGISSFRTALRKAFVKSEKPQLVENAAPPQPASRPSVINRLMQPKHEAKPANHEQVVTEKPVASNAERPTEAPKIDSLPLAEMPAPKSESILRPSPSLPTATLAQPIGSAVVPAAAESKSLVGKLGEAKTAEATLPVPAFPATLPAMQLNATTSPMPSLPSATLSRPVEPQRLLSQLTRDELQEPQPVAPSPFVPVGEPQKPTTPIATTPAPATQVPPHSTSETKLHPDTPFRTIEPAQPIVGRPVPAVAPTAVPASTPVAASPTVAPSLAPTIHPTAAGAVGTSAMTPSTMAQPAASHSAVQHPAVQHPAAQQAVASHPVASQVAPAVAPQQVAQYVPATAPQYYAQQPVAAVAPQYATAVRYVSVPYTTQYVAAYPQAHFSPVTVRPAVPNQTPVAFAQAPTRGQVGLANYTTVSQVEGAPVPAHMPNGGVPMQPFRYDQPSMPGYAWPSYAAYPNYAGLTYPKQYSPTAWPYIGPFYPYPQVPLGWRKVALEWDDGWWHLDFWDK